MGISHLTRASWRFSIYTDCSCPPQSVKELVTTGEWSTPMHFKPLPWGKADPSLAESFSKTASSSLCKQLRVEVQQGKMGRDFGSATWALSQVLLLLFFFCSGEAQTNSKTQFCCFILLAKSSHFLDDNRGEKSNSRRYDVERSALKP